MAKTYELNLENFLFHGIKTGVFLLLLTPLILSSFSVFPSVFPKTVYFRTLVEIIASFYIILLIFSRRYLPKISPIFISLLIFIEVLAFSVFKSVNPWRSFWGTMERMEGFLTPFHFFIFFFILVAVFKDKKDWLNFLKFSVFVSLAVGLAGIIQKAGIFDFYAYIDPKHPRISATLGNPVFYGNYLTLIIFLSIFLAFLEEKKISKIIYWLISLFNIFLLLLTGTRGAWVGTIVGGIFLLFIWFLFFSQKLKEKRKIVLFSIFILTLFFLFFLLFSKMGYIPRTSFLERYELIFDNLVNFKDPRAFVWPLGIRAWRDSPLFGFGLESFSYLYDKYYQSNFLESIPEVKYYDRAHNKIIDSLVTSGILGLLSYLAIFVSLILVIVKNRDKLGALSSFVLISLFLAYFTQNIFAFDTVNSYLIFFLLLGFVDIFFRKEKRRERKKEEAVEDKSLEKLKNLNSQAMKSLFVIKLVVLVLVFSLTALSVYIVNIRPLTASVRLAKGRTLLVYNKVEEAVDVFNRSFIPSDFTNFENKFYASAMLYTALPRFSQHKDKDKQKIIISELKNLSPSLERHLQEKPEVKTMNIYLLLARIYKSIYLIDKDEKYLDKEEEILGKAIRFNPQFIMIYRLSGEIRFIQKRYEEGMIFFVKAYQMDKNFAKFNEWKGIAFLESGDKKRGADALRMSLKFSDFYRNKNKFNLNTIWKLADLYKEVGDYKSIIELYKEAIRLHPKEITLDPQIYASLSAVYAKIGDKEKARETILEMIKLYPQLKSRGEEFLSNLEKK